MALPSSSCKADIQKSYSRYINRGRWSSWSSNKFNGIQVERPSQHQFVMIARFAYPKLQQNLIAGIAILKSQYRKH
ncbi:hypothetical protein LHK34_13895, partial [Staphylococcus argenteus]|nr:hypothetical protein [Staphylococcus argenteus]